METLMLTLDGLVKLLPAGAVLSGVFVARAQMGAVRRAAAVTIAKNHYRETHELFIKNSDIVFLGTKEESYLELAANVPLMRRYRWLFTTAMFALQELYCVFVIGREKDPYWARTIILIGSVFRCHLLSDEHFPEYIRSGYNPAFIKYMVDGVQSNVHPAASSSLSDFIPSPSGEAVRVYQT